MTETYGAKCGFLLIGLFSVAMGAFAPSTARAQPDELREFEAARQAYTDADYPRAVRLFEPLVGGPVPSIQNAALVLESRKYLGAAYLFVGRPTDADGQFEALLRADPAYLIPAAFPEAVQEAFESVRHRLASHTRTAAEESARRERERRAAELRRLVAQQERIRRLEHLASLEVVEHDNSRAIAMLPFGIGQFQNEDNRLGRILAYTEGGLALISLGTAIGRVVQRSRADRLDPTFLRRSRTAVILTNWTSFGALGVVALAGMIQAQVRFRPRIRHERVRPLPPSLELPGDADATPPWDAAPPSDATPRARDDHDDSADTAGDLSLSLGPGSVGLRLTF